MDSPGPASSFESFLASPLLWGVIGIVTVALALTGKLDVSAAKWLLVVAWAMAVFSVYRAAPVLRQPLVPRLLLVMLFAGMIGLCLYAISVWMSDKPVAAQNVTEQEPTPTFRPVASPAESAPSPSNSPEVSRVPSSETPSPTPSPVVAVPTPTSVTPKPAPIFSPSSALPDLTSDGVTRALAPQRPTIRENSAGEIVGNLKGITPSYRFYERAEELYVGRWTRESGWQATVHDFPSKLPGGHWFCSFREVGSGTPIFVITVQDLSKLRPGDSATVSGKLSRVSPLGDVSLEEVIVQSDNVPSP